LYDVIIPPRTLRPKHSHKTLLNTYSPFDETLFIDADSIVVRPLDEVFEHLEGQSFSLIGSKRTKGEWYFDIASMIVRLDVNWIPKFNSGLIFFRRSKQADAVFLLSNAIMGAYDSFGIRYTKASRSDEPCFAIALGQLGIAPVADNGRIMQTPIQLEGKLHVDPVRGICRFRRDGVIVEPAVIHFVSRTKHRDYALARFQLHLNESYPILRQVNRPIAAILSWGWSAAGKVGLIER
jgi:hypothetical protein